MIVECLQKDNLNNGYFCLKNKRALKKTLENEHLFKIKLNGITKYYANGSHFIENGIRQRFVNAYGVGYNNGKYFAFITDENGDPLIYLEEFEFESDACESLFEKILKLKD